MNVVVIRSPADKPWRSATTYDLVEPGLRERARDIGFPLIVKPLREGGHLGVSEDTIVRDGNAFEQTVGRVAERFRQPSLVERYLDGPGLRILSFEAAQHGLDYPALVQRLAEEALQRAEEGSGAAAEPRGGDT